MTEGNEAAKGMKEMILRAKNGDRSAFDTLYNTYAIPVYRYVFLRLRNVNDAEDITQETFMKAYQAIERYSDETGNMLPYLFTIARNLLINHTKKKRPEVYLPEEMNKHEGSEQASDLAMARERTEEIRSAMSQLSETEREIVELKFFGELSYTEIAEILGKREDAIRQHVARSIKKMRSVLKGDT